MFQRLPIVAVAGLLCAFAYLLATGIAVPEAATGRAMFIVSAVSLFVSVLASAVALIALTRAASLDAKLKRLTKSVDSAFTAFIAERDREVAAEDDLEPPPASPEPLEYPFTSLSVARAVNQEPGGPAPATNVVPHPAIRRQTGTPMQSLGQNDLIEHALKDADAPNGSMQLRPIISTADGTVAGFEIVRAEDSAIVLPSVSPHSEMASRLDEELELISAALDVVTDHLTANRQPVPVHIAISNALLNDPDGPKRLLSLLQSQPNAARYIVLSLPIGRLVEPAAMAKELARMTLAGARFSSEGWPDSDGQVEALWRSGVTFLRLPTERLLTTGADRSFDKALPSMLRARGIRIIAAGANPAEDAPALWERGVELVATAYRANISAAGTGAPPRYDTPTRHL